MFINVSQLNNEQINKIVYRILHEGEAPLLNLKEEYDNTGSLPYVFDLCYDLKDWSEIKEILEDKRYHAPTKKELLNFTKENGYWIDGYRYPAYVTDWKEGGPLLDRFNLRVEPFWENGRKRWRAAICTPALAIPVVESAMMEGETALHAAMQSLICYNFGMSVDVSENEITTSEVNYES